ncbi:MAG: acyltransferase domain-containing protein [Actinobacteria bacterium]|nr:acyltransferase domain-containing protein [Actinomycetota bacterium]
MTERTVALFPGQGIPAKEVLSALPEKHALLDVANAVVGHDIKRKVEVASRRGNQPLPTSVAQTAIFAAGMIAWNDAPAHERAVDFLAGHSLGEYTALVAGGAMTFETGMAVVEARGRAMQIAARAAGGGMAALLGFSLAEAENIAAQSGAVVANDNAPNQVVISGSEESLTEAAAAARSRGGRAVLLQVSGSFHSPSMDPAVFGLQKALDYAEVGMPEIPVVSNVTARPYRSPGEIRKLLTQQLTGKVRFRESVNWLADSGVGSCHDFGPGRVVAGLFARTIEHREAARAGS